MPALDLRQTTLVNPNVFEQADQAFSQIQQLKTEITKTLGVGDIPRPPNSPLSLSELDINTISNSELMMYYTQYVAYATFVGCKLAELRCAEKIAKSNLKRVIAEIKAGLHDQGIRGADVIPAVQRHPKYQQYDKEHARIFMMVTIVTAYYRTYADQAKALSRTIEIKKLEFEQSIRQGNFNKRAVPGFRRAT